MSEAVLQQTVTVISSDVPRLIPPTQLSAQIDAAVSISLERNFHSMHTDNFIRQCLPFYRVAIKKYNQNNLC